MAARRGNVLAVVGGQYGSEGKGVVVHYLANRYDAHVRVGGPNAGHSFNHEGSVFKMQALPCGWTNRHANLVIGRGAIVNPALLAKEIEMVQRSSPSVKNRIFIDAGAGVLSDDHHNEEGGTGGELHQRIGSTGEGVGAARHARMRRDPAGFQRIYEVAAQYGLDSMVYQDTASCLMRWLDSGDNILLEGTQGSGLSLIHGPWPYVTTADTNAAQMAADIGLAPRLVNRTCLVVRSHPIRVAGNSGPLKGELSWADLSRDLGRTVEERTTVTKKVRRVGSWDEDLVLQSVLLNQPTSLALMFADYISPEDEGKRTMSSLSTRTKKFVEYLERLTGVAVALIGTGGPSWAIVDRGLAL